MSQHHEAFQGGEAGLLCHPANSWWEQDADITLTPDYAAIELGTRFGDETPHLIANIEATSARCLADQREEERENLAILSGGGVNLDTYNRIATYPELAAEYVAWFASVASAGLHRYNATHAIQKKKVALELFGTVLQHGDWESAHQLDEYARNLKSSLEADPACEVMCLERKHEIPKKYVFYPTFDVADQDMPAIDLQYGSDFEKAQDILENGATWLPPASRFGHIERWRGVADMRFNGENSGTVRIFKRSGALVQLGDEQIHLADRQTIQTLLHETRNTDEREVAMNIISRIIGRTFEASIKSEHGHSRAIIPTSAKYVMMYTAEK
jgi:hypothetical protein